MKERIKIIITDDQSLSRNGLKALLEPENIIAIAEAANGLELLALLESKVKPNVVLLDIEMPKLDGKKTLIKIRALYPHLKVIMLSTFSEACLVEDFREHGANAFLTKDSATDTIIETIRQVHKFAGYSNFPDKQRYFFSPGEIKVIPLLLAGKKVWQIAQTLGITESTVQNRLLHLYEKTATKNASEFSKFCTKRGLEFLGSGDAIAG